ncbi:uroporphyrinogen-III synthase [Halogranum gelatinilyticum]|uniref:Uroporphyrinogen-III synthase n=1 Tax=Halogranum gelatinilyticum TaxID=660521 RepID=A0A1G9Z3C7_9EURY|nr:uroporphyrinogen-III synthase [Halogranum gelatinilyticum]SDN15958.1 uroporphyrinogen-III synthase [Halogranum gelatinilyticum]
MSKPTVAVLRPDDDRITEAVKYLRSLGVTAVADPMLTIRLTGKTLGAADYCVFTSRTGVEIAVEQNWYSSKSTVCAVGQQTASALRDDGIPVDIVPSTFTSTGLVEELAAEVDGSTVEIARSAHGSDVLIQGLETAGADVYETQLYRLDRPTDAGRSVTLATDGQLDGILFSSPRTVNHFCEIAAEQTGLPALQRGMTKTIIGAIGLPTARAIWGHGITVDVIPDTVGFSQLADRTVEEIDTRN